MFTEATADQVRTATLDHMRRLATLPDWLVAVAQPERVQSAFVRHVPEFASGDLRLVACEVKRVRLKEQTWNALYQLTVDEPWAGQRQILLRGTLIPPTEDLPQNASAGIFGVDSWRWLIPDLRLHLRIQPPDAELPSLPLLIDPANARALLERSISAGTPAYGDLRIAACTPRIMRFKPGSRCTVLYDLAYAGESAERAWPALVVAKTYHGDKGQNAYDGMRALWNSPLAAGDVVHIAEPLAYLAEMNVLIQGPVQGEETLKMLIRSALAAGSPHKLQQLQSYLRKTASGLAALHSCGVTSGDLRDWKDELAEVRDVLDRLASAAPQLDGVGAPLLSRLEALNAAWPADPPVPSHGTFRPAQVLLDHGEIGFIDFDGFCQAEPALDIALFLGKIKDIGLSVSETGEDDGDVAAMRPASLETRLAQIDALCATFLEMYVAHAPVSRQRIALWETLDLLTLVLHCWTKVKTARLNNTMLLLERHLRGDWL